MSYIVNTLANQKTNIAYLKTNVSSFHYAGPNWSNIPGGQISYTPTSSSAEIILEFTTGVGSYNGDAWSAWLFRLQIGNTSETLGDVVTNNIDYYSSFGCFYTGSGALGQAKNSSFSNVITIKFKLPGWTGQKVLQVQCKKNSNTQDYYGRAVVNATNSQSWPYNPFIIVYEI